MEEKLAGYFYAFVYVLDYKLAGLGFVGQA